MQNAFYFMLKVLFALEIFTFLSWIFGYIEKRHLIRKLRLIPKLRTSQTGQQIVTIHMLSNILRSKGNRTLRFGQLIEYNMRNIFQEKSYTKCGGKVSPRPSRLTVWNNTKFVFITCANGGLPKYIETAMPGVVACTCNPAT